MWPGQAMSLKVDEVLYHQRSKFQDVLVFRSESYGNVLVLDGVIQTTDRDEFSYQEMMAHVPMLSHPDPKRVLIVGGGDGGVLREVCRHPGVEHVCLVDIDGDVIDVSKRFLPNLSAGFKDPRATVHVGDGFQYLRDHPASYDVIITDSSDPVGPAEVLFQREYFQLLKQSLAPGGVVCCQGECMWLHLPLIKKVTGMCGELFDHVDYAYTCIPTYPSGQIGLLLCGSRPFRKPVRALPDAAANALRYYTPAIHEAAFVLPAFAQRAIYGPDDAETS